ncbi:Kae1-associated serine/threonine protein kinase [archaeon]|nr:Kae1-associated serine/threonine protein kinase [archaeon]
MKKLISQGAEAKIFVDYISSHFFDSPTIHKIRTPKSYRHPQLDTKIRTRRTRSEAKIINKAASFGINVPKIDSIDKETQTIFMTYIEGDRLSETLNSYPEKKQFTTIQKLGKQTALLHKNNIIHGDLTTSNTILSEDKLFIIDFGLGFISTKIEDKAVDLHLIKQALEAKHFQNHTDLFTNFLKTYKDEEVIKRLEVVEKRGRYKH